MTTFGWKKKSAALKRPFECDDLEVEELPPKSPKNSETKAEQILRLKNEGIFHAEKEEFWHSVSKFDDAIQLINEDEERKEETKTFHEMKAQSLIQLHEWEPAIESASIAIHNSSKSWAPAYQTLGRAHLGNGQVFEAVIALEKAVIIDPDDQELREDLSWAQSLRTHLKLMQAAREINQQ